MAFDLVAALRPDVPAAPGAWTEPPPFAFVGGHGDPDSVPATGLGEALVNALRREGPRLATYNLGGSPLGYAPLREFVASNLAARATMPADPDEVLIVSGSLQALDLVNAALVAPGDTVVVEQATYGGMLSRLDRIGARVVGVELDRDGMRIDHLAEVLDGLAADGTPPRYVYTIPTVQNPTGTVMPVERRRDLLALARRHAVPVFEDDCYADLLWGRDRPPSIRALDQGGGQVVYCGSFSKTVAPALRVGYLVADGPVVRAMAALKTDAGTGALEQIALGEYAPHHFDDHVERLTDTLRGKCDVMLAALHDELGDLIEVDPPMGGIYVWVTLPEGIDTTALVPAAAEVGVEFNAGAAWSTDPAYGARRLRLCFGHPSHEEIRAGVAALAGVVRRVSAV